MISSNTQIGGCAFKLKRIYVKFIQLSGFIYRIHDFSVNCACTISEEITCSVLKTVGKLCKLMKALTVRFLQKK